jgi:hypothetical protein
MRTRKTYGRGPTFTGRIQIQPGSELSIGKDQAATYTEIWKGRYDDLVRQTPTKDAPHGTYTELLLESKRIVRDKSGKGTAYLIYKGLDPARGGPGTVIDPNDETNFPEVDLEIDTDVEEVPIQAHPRFVSSLIPAAGGRTSSNPASQYYEEIDGRPAARAHFNDDGTFAGFGIDATGNLAGVESYYVPRTLTTRHWYSRSKANENVGVIVGGQMRISIRSTRQGRVWKNTEVLRGGNWNSLIYPA